MKYYQVNQVSDQVKFNTTFLIGQELYTAKQLKNVSGDFIKKHFTEVEVSKNDTYYCFGARFRKKYVSETFAKATKQVITNE